MNADEIIAGWIKRKNEKRQNEENRKSASQERRADMMARQYFFDSRKRKINKRGKVGYFHKPKG